MLKMRSTGIGFLIVLMLGGCGSVGETGEERSTGDDILAESSLTPEVGASRDELVYSGIFRDWSGQLEVYVRDCGWSSPAHHPEKICSMDNAYTLIGGGAEVETGKQAMLYASYPDGQNWVARSKDHEYQAVHKVRSWAIGLRIIGLDPSRLRSLYMCYGQASASGQHISVQARPQDPSCQVVGGGAQVALVGGGQLLVGSYPSGVRADPSGSWTTPTEWSAESKDHKFPVISTLTAYAIGIKNVYIPELGSTIQVNYAEGLSSRGGGFVDMTKMTGLDLTWPWVPSCVGGRAENWSAGRLLTKLVPLVDNAVPGAYVQTKDHIYADVSNTRAFIASIRKW